MRMCQGFDIGLFQTSVRPLAAARLYSKQLIDSLWWGRWILICAHNMNHRCLPQYRNTLRSHTRSPFKYGFALNGV